MSTVTNDCDEDDGHSNGHHVVSFAAVSPFINHHSTGQPRQHFQLRRKLFACFASCGRDNDNLARIMSPEFQDFALEKLGTRRLTVNAGPWIEQARESMGADCCNSSSHRVSGILSEAALDTNDNEQDIFIVNDRNTSRIVEDTEEEDELCERLLVEVRRGKGGMFSRCVYSRRRWSHLRDRDIGECDALILFMDFDYDAVKVVSAMQLSRGDTQVIRRLAPSAADGLSIEQLVLVEALHQRHHCLIIVMLPNVAERRDCAMFTLLEQLQRAGRLQLIYSFNELEQALEGAPHSTMNSSATAAANYATIRNLDDVFEYLNDI
jgi:hypothetical protein